MIEDKPLTEEEWLKADSHIRWLDSILREVPDRRYRRLIVEVLDRLPEGWDRGYDPEGWGGLATSPCKADVEYSFRLSLDAPKGVLGATCRDYGDYERSQIWYVFLYKPNLDPLSDAHIKHTIAHELGHIALRQPHKPETFSERKDGECAAERLAYSWGFKPEG